MKYKKVIGLVVSVSWALASLWIGAWMTDKQGNLARKSDGVTDYMKHAVRIE